MGSVTGCQSEVEPRGECQKHWRRRGWSKRKVGKGRDGGRRKGGVPSIGEQFVSPLHIHTVGSRPCSPTTCEVRVKRHASGFSQFSHFCFCPNIHGPLHANVRAYVSSEARQTSSREERPEKKTTNERRSWCPSQMFVHLEADVEVHVAA